MHDDLPLSVRVERAGAASSAAFADVIAEQDPTWRSETHRLAGGWLVLCGAGLYVNRGLALGIDQPLTTDELELLESRSGAVGVAAAVEVTHAAHPGTRDLLESGGYVIDPAADVTEMVYPSDLPPPANTGVGVDVVPIGERSLEQWMAVSAAGWGHVTPAALRAAEAFARAASVVDGDGMVIAVDSSDGRPVGCASLTIWDGIATLGGMSTLPDERGRGVQSALIRHRIGVARAAGCDVVTSSASSGGTSERNLLRHGFRRLHTKRRYIRTAADRLEVPR